MERLGNLLADMITGASIGIIIAVIILGLARIAENGPINVPVLTPLWERMKGGIERPIRWLDTKIRR